MRSHNTLFNAGEFAVDDYISGFVHDGTKPFEAGFLKTTLMSILTAEMDDKHDYISWWLYESTEDKTVTWTENGVERSVDLTTPEALYDYIVESHLERERSGHT